MKKVFASLLLEVTMIDNLKIYISKITVEKIGSLIIFLVQELLNKIELWKEKIELYRRWLK